jgi:hypothetical protein
MRGIAMKTAALVTAVAACTSAPAAPTWQGDVMPIYASNCVRCHGRPAAFGAPTSFRLDVYEDTPDPDHPGMVIRGAGTMSYRAYERVRDGTMPPVFPTVGDAADVLANWSEKQQGAARGMLAQPPKAGTARAGNQAPTITITPGATDGDFDYEIDDDDFDLVHGVVVLDDAMTPWTIVSDDLHNGRGTFHVDTASIPAGSHSLAAFLDDGASPFVFSDKTGARLAQPMGGPTKPNGSITFTVSHPGGAPPTVAFIQPRPYALLRGTLFVRLAAADLDGDLQRVALQLIDLEGAHQPITLPDYDLTGAYPPIPLHDLEGLSGDHWVLQATATDAAGHVTTATTTQLAMANGDPTQTSFAAVLDTFGACAGCHDPCGEPFTIPNMSHAWGFATGAGAPCQLVVGPNVTIDGVTEGDNPGLIYDRVFRRGDMPPGNQPPLDPTQRDQLKAYLLAGAPP